MLYINTHTHTPYALWVWNPTYVYKKWNHTELHAFSITYATADSCLIQSHLSWLGIHIGRAIDTRDIQRFATTYCEISQLLPIITHTHTPFMDNSGKVWLIRTSINISQYCTNIHFSAARYTYTNMRAQRVSYITRGSHRNVCKT